jgi:Putative zinc-finger
MKNGSQPQSPLIYRVTHVVLGPVLKLFHLSCKDAFELSSEQMDRELTRGEAFRLRIHLAICGICRHLPRQFQVIRELVRACEHEHAMDAPCDAQLPAEAKERIAQELKKM